MSSLDRRIIHLDMDAFYASVEQRDRPELRGKPVAVGGPPERRGVVAAASYEARVFGIRSAVSMSKAVRLCPSLVIVTPDFAKYRAISRQVFQLFHAVTPTVEPIALDEAYLDVTTNAWDEPLATTVARRLKRQIHQDTGLTASAGVAPNKFLAKIASGWRKPDGLTVVAGTRIEPFLQRIPIEAVWGVGPVTARKLRAAAITRLVDLRAIDEVRLRRLVGAAAAGLKRLALGIDERPVVANRAAKSHSSECTYAEDLDDLGAIQAEIERMARRNTDWLAARNLDARTVTIKVRYRDFTTVTRSHTAPRATRAADEVVRRARRLLSRTDAGRRPVRLLGVGVHGLGDTADRRAPTDGPLLWETVPVAGV